MRGACALTLLLTLGACATFQSVPKIASANGEEPDRELTGRISVHYHDFSTDHEETVFANFDWSERDQNVDLVLLDPLGQSIAKVKSGPTSSTLTLNDGRVYSGLTPEALTNQVLGWTLPVTGLRAWLEGHPENAASAKETTETDGSRRIVENGWTIAYPAPSDPQTASEAPKRLNLSYPGPKIALDLRVVIDSRSGS